MEAFEYENITTFPTRFYPSELHTFGLYKCLIVV